MMFIKKYKKYALALVLLITFITLYPSLENSLTNWDDHTYIINNTLIHDLSWNNIKSIFTDFFSGNYHPLTLLSFAAEYKFFKLNAFFYHFTNLSFHIMNCALVFWFFNLLFGDFFVSILIALLFGIHPLHVESVAWISERKDVLYTFFFFGSVISYLYYKKNETKLYLYYFSLFLFVLSLLSKGQAVVLPVVLLLCDYIKDKKLGMKQFKEKLTYFVLALSFGVVAIVAQRVSKAMDVAIGLTPVHSLVIASYGIVFYISKLIVPLNLSNLYPYPKEVSNIFSLPFIIPAVCAIGILAYIYLEKRNNKKIIFGTTFFLVNYLPVSQILPVGRAIAADRYMYIASLGLFFLFAEFILWANKKICNFRIKYLLAAFLLFFAGTFSLISFNRCKVWKNGVTLWTDAISKDPKSFLAYYTRGTAYANYGENDKARPDFEKSLELNPVYSKTYYGLGNLDLADEKYDEAIANFSRAILTDPDNALAYNNRGFAFAVKGELNKALSDYYNAIKIDSDYAKAYFNISGAYLRKRNLKEAAIYLKKAESLGYENKENIEKLKKEIGSIY